MSSPPFVYGTAWKEERTETLTRQALAAGFRAIDTANQRKHYVEAAVGKAIAGFPRGELFLQTKFTYADGQDHRLPYDPAASPGQQVHQSFHSSLEHLGVDHLDSYLLHGPSAGSGWNKPDREVWREMEALHDAGQARKIGVSNINLAQLRLLCDSARILPAFVQNRCYARNQWDGKIREFCRERGIVYQGFSLLTANRAELGGPVIGGIAARLGVEPSAVVFRFALAVGMWPLTGTSSPAHMAGDLAAADLALTDEDVAAIERG